MRFISLILMAVVVALLMESNGGRLAAATNSYPLIKNRDQIRLMIETEAKRMRFSVPLALSVAHAESHFNPRALSKKGARGVMQIMPATSIGEYGINPDQLWEPIINIRMGIHFLRRLIKQYGRTDLALSHYNGGSAVAQFGNARVLPWTHSYVRKVRRLQRRYYRNALHGGWR